MKKLFLLSFALLTVTCINAQTKHTITIGWQEFVPNNLTITQGDTVEWVNNSPYSANVNGSQAAYPNNAEYFYSGSPFSPLPPWVYSHVFTVVGTNYAVSDPHASRGMICIITVQAATTEITEINTDDKVKVFPNPATDYFSIQTKQPLKSVLLYNISGKLVKTYTQTTGQLNNFDTKALPKGIYFLTIEVEDAKLVEKLIIQ